MRRIVFDPPEGLDDDQRAWWTSWAQRAADKQADFVERRRNGDPVEFDSTVWRDLKDWLLRHVFFGKCAYCETKILPGYPGDGEHYRPKGNVTVKGEDGIKRAVQRAENARHPGYYWLAYDWRNLLPACFLCNNAKSDQFPVGTSHVHDAAPAAVDLDASEAPLLIYPYRDEPDKYLVFGKLGIVAARDGDPRGQKTIEVFNLNRDDLIDARQQRQGEVKLALARAIELMLEEDDVQEQEKPLDAYLQAWIGPAAPYSKAVRDYINLRLPHLWHRLQGA